jgi:hypothetical protein
MPTTAQESARSADGKPRRASGWYVLLLAWIAYAAAFFAFSKTAVKAAADITDYRLLEYGPKYGPSVGVALGLAAFLATGIVYLIARRFVRNDRLLLACVLTALGYGVWLLFGWDLVYREPRYAEVARAIITYLGKPMLYSAEIVCGLALVGAVLSVIFKKRRTRPV